MASPFSGVVLVSGAALSSPALWEAFVEGTMPLSTAVVRLFVAVVVAWIGLTMLETLLAATADSPGSVDETGLAQQEMTARAPGSDGSA